MRQRFPEATRLGFGCASLGSRVSERAGLRAMAEAFEHGVSWFDLAPSYGDGEAETIFAGFAAGKRDRIQICTKCGIGRARISGLAGRIRPLVRLALRVAPGVRGLVAARRPPTRAQQLSANLIETSIEDSLRRLRVEQVDVYALHDPDPEDLRREEVMSALARVRDSGKARAIGIAGSRDAVLAAFRAGLPVGHIQVADESDVMELTRAAPLALAPPLLVTHSVFRRTDEPSSAAEKLTGALTRNPDGVVLVSMFNKGHRDENLACVRRCEMQLSRRPAAVAQDLTGAG
ncbi:MAG: aldo/keto reductase [Caulobacter sp.]|nr:aldo/keto reductase [Caulobacter sp.]